MTTDNDNKVVKHAASKNKTAEKIKLENEVNNGVVEDSGDKEDKTKRDLSKVNLKFKKFLADEIHKATGLPVDTSMAMFLTKFVYKLPLRFLMSLEEEDFDAYGERAIALPGVGKYRILNTVARGRRLDVVGTQAYEEVEVPEVDANGDPVLDANKEPKMKKERKLDDNGNPIPLMDEDGKPVLEGTYPRFKYYPSYHIECEVEALAGLTLKEDAKKTYDRGSKEEDKGVKYFHDAIRKMFESKLPDVEIDPVEVGDIIRDFLVAYMQKANTSSAAKVLGDYLDKKMIEASSIAAGVTKPSKPANVEGDRASDLEPPDEGFDENEKFDESDDEDGDKNSEVGEDAEDVLKEATAPNNRKADPMDVAGDDLPDEMISADEGVIAADDKPFGSEDPSQAAKKEAADKNTQSIDSFDFDL